MSDQWWGCAGHMYETLFVFEYCQLCVGFASIEVVLIMLDWVDRHHVSLCTFIETSHRSRLQRKLYICICLFCILAGIGFFHSIVEYRSVYESNMLFVSIFQSSVGPFSRYTTTLWVISLQTTLVDIGVFEYPRESFRARMVKPMVPNYSQNIHWPS